MLKSGKVLVLGILLYLWPRAFLDLHKKWGYEGTCSDEMRDRIYSMRQRLWRALGLVGVVVIFTVILLGKLGYAVGSDGYWLRIAAVVVALSATLGRGGWEIQTWKGQSIPERIDCGMYKISQIGAAVLLIFVLSL